MDNDSYSQIIMTITNNRFFFHKNIIFEHDLLTVIDTFLQIITVRKSQINDYESQ